MFINYTSTRQELGFKCLRDLEDQKRISLFVKRTTVSAALTYCRVCSFNPETRDIQQFNNHLSTSPSYEMVLPPSLNQISSNYNVLGLRGGTNESTETSEKINKALKEAESLETLAKNVTSKSLEVPENFTKSSLNKNTIRILNKLAPLMTNQDILRVLAESQKPLKVNLSPSGTPSTSQTKTMVNKELSKSSSLFVEALIPINPHRWPAFTAGSIMASDMRDFNNKLQNPVDNLIAARDYLETSHSDVQWRDRCWQIMEDTVKMNLASELGSDVGSFAAGAASNAVANGYMEEMLMTELTKNAQERLNLQIYKHMAREQNMDPSRVRGTGTLRQFVPDSMKENLSERPERNSRPDSWENKTPSSSKNDSSFE